MDQKPAAPQNIAQALIDRIRAGMIAEGDPLPTERELGEDFSASRPTVREALHLMSLRGYALTGGSRRPRAARPSMTAAWAGALTGICDAVGDGAGLAQIEQIRQFIETSAAAFAAREARQIDLARMAEALRNCDAALGDHDAFLSADRAFHAALVGCVGNEALVALSETLLARLIAGRDQSDRIHENDRVSCDEHHRIFDAIVSREADLAATLMRGHLDRAFRSRLRDRVGGISP